MSSTIAIETSCWMYGPTQSICICVNIYGFFDNIAITQFLTREDINEIDKILVQFSQPNIYTSHN